MARGSATIAGRRASRSTRLGRLRVHGRGLGRSLRDLAARAREEGRRRAGRRERAARRRRARRATRRDARRRRRRRAAAADGRSRWPTRRRQRTASRWRSTTSCARRWRASCRSARARRATTASLDVLVDRERARFGAWYEMFPRSAGTDPARSATFARSGGAAAVHRAMGFDVLYLPPIHPIGRSFRKGRNNALTAGPGDPGSPWAIGADGGRPHGDRAGARHARRLRSRSSRAARAARPRDRARPRLPVLARSSVGARASRVVPPSARRHDQVRGEPAEEVPGHLPARLRVRRLAGAVARAAASHRVLDRPRRARSSASTTRTPSRSRSGSGCSPRSSAQHPDDDLPVRGVHAAEGDALSGQGRFSQSYTYFTWRNTKAELTEYFTELTQTDVARVPAAEPVRQHARHPARVPAARRPAGVPGAARPRGDARRELRHLQRLRAVRERAGAARAARSTSTRRSTRSGRATATQPDSLAELIARVNAIRREHPALQRDWGLRFHATDNPRAASATASGRADGADLILVVVNLDPLNMQHGFVAAAARRLGPGADDTLDVHDLLSTSATTGAASGTTSASIRDIRVGTHPVACS